MTVSKITNANMFRVLLHIIVVASLLIMLLPVAGSTASAESDNISEILLMPTDNVTVDVSFETRNTTEMTQDNHAEEKKVKEDKKEKKVKPVNTKEVDKHYFLVEPDKENKLELPSKKATLSIPKGAIEETIIVEIGDIPAPGSTGTRILNLFEFNAWEADTDILESFSENGTSVIDTLTDNTTLEEPETADNTSTEISDNVTIETPDTTDNITLEESEIADNTTSELPEVTDNVTIEIPDTTDNITPELPDVTDNVTIETPDTTDNITLEEPEISDNTTSELPEVTDNVTFEFLNATDNMTLEEPETADNTTSENEGFSENITKEKKLNDKLNKEQLKSAIKIENKVSEFNESLTIEIQHSPGDLKGLDPGSLKLYYLNEEKNQWQLVQSSFYDKSTRKLTATIDHFSTYGEQANPLEVGPGRVMASDVNLHSGTVTYSYPIELPPGPGGFKPELNLIYNSGSVDEMKNKQDVGSWVGIGWSLHFGKITYSFDSGLYYLNLNNASYELGTYDDVNYYTIPDQHLKITRLENNATWEVRDASGNYYRFGYLPDAIQYMPEIYGGNYRWDLSLIRDTNGNEAEISYKQTVVDTDEEMWIRSSYPEYLTYVNNEIHFLSSSNTSDNDGPVRNDNPISSGSNDAPKVMENYQLDSVVVKTGGNLVRSYDFDYCTTNRNYSSDYSGVYYSGNHTLVSVTQIGSDGSSELPPITFEYEGLQTYRHGSESGYTGNPGNPASFNWPHLTTINSGYGGKIEFEYTQIHDTSVVNSWTREAVTGKYTFDTVNSSISHTYAYDGNPVYYGTGWDQEYCGFNLVTEINAEGNYTEHYFYTTEIINNIHSPVLSGKEFKTQWYASNNTLLKEVNYDWSYEYSGGFITEEFTPCLGGYTYRYDSDPKSWQDIRTGQGTVSIPSMYYHPYHYGTIVLDYYTNDWYHQLWRGYVLFDTTILRDKGIIATANLSLYCAGKSDPINIQPNVNIYEATPDSDTSLYQFDYGLSHFGSTPFSDTKSYSSITGGYNIFLLNDDGLAAISPIEISRFGVRNVNYDVNGNPPTRKDSGDNSQLQFLLDPEESPQSVLAVTYALKYELRLDQVEEITCDNVTGNRTTCTRYEYDNYGNVIKEYRDGDVQNDDDDYLITRSYNFNTDDNILSLPSEELIYSGNTTSANLTGRTVYYYDGAASNTTTPEKGLLTRTDIYSSATEYITGNMTYDSFGNILSQEDALGNITRWEYDSNGIHPEKKILPNGFEETYSYLPGTDYVANVTDINGQTTSYTYDEFKRLIMVLKPGDNITSPGMKYLYNDWGSIGLQNIEIITKTSDSGNLSQKDYFDGLGRVIQTHSSAESGNISISGTVEYNNRGLVEKQYVPQLVDNTTVNGYYEPESGWRYSTCEYDALGRVISQTAADNTTVHRDYSVPWEEKLINESGNMTRYEYNAFGQLLEVEEYISGNVSYAKTQYSYDTLGNLVQVKDAENNTTNMTYNWLSQKLTMVDPDMGSWSYTYDSRGNLETQTDAKNNTSHFNYDVLNRLVKKSYTVADANTAATSPVTYTYDDVTGRNYGKGLRTAMTDDLGTVHYTYDERGRLISENRSADVADGYIKLAIVIDYTKIDEDLTHFPLLLHLSSDCGQGSDDLSAIFKKVGDDFLKISVTEEDGVTPLYVEIESWDASSQEAWLWVSGENWTISSSQETVIYLYFDDQSGINDEYIGEPGSPPAEKVWDSHHLLVNHMQDAGASSCIDSTTYENDGTKVTSGHPYETPGIIGYGQSFNGSGDFIDCGDADSIINTEQGTVSAWIRTSDLGIMLSGENTDFGPRLEFYSCEILGNGVTFDSYHYDYYTCSVHDDKWHNITWTSDSNEWGVYFDGGPEDLYQLSGSNNGNWFADYENYGYGLNDIAIGVVNDNELDHYFNGLMDEVVISDIPRSDAWVKASYYAGIDDLLNYSTKSGFTNWENCVEITLDSSNFDEDLTHFPVLLHLNADCGLDSDDMTALFDEVGNDYKKLRVIQDDGLNQLYVEVESWNATAEEAWLWVSAENWNISASEDTRLYLYYDSLYDDNDEYVGEVGSVPAQAVWDQYYESVYHMTDDPEDNSVIPDSTGSENYGSKYSGNETEEVDGCVGKAQDFTDAYSILLTNAWNLENPFTFEALARVETDEIPLVLFSQSDSEGLPTTDKGFGLTTVDTTDKLYAVAYDNYPRLFNTGEDNGSDWRYFTVVRTPDDFVSTYRDSFWISDTLVSGNITSSYAPTIGGTRARSTNNWNDCIDEVRVSSTERSDAWRDATCCSMRDELVRYKALSNLSGWSNSIKLTIDNTKIDDGLTQFPVLLRLSDESGINGYDMTAVFNEIGNNYKKIAVTEEDRVTQLNVEVETWNAEDKEASLWISRPGWSISSTSDTTLYLLFDKNQRDNIEYVGITGSGPAQGVWDDSFVMVHHMKGNDITRTVKDSTSNGNDGTKRSASEPYEIQDSTGYSQKFDGLDDIVTVDDSVSLNVGYAVTVEVLSDISQPVINYEMLAGQWDVYNNQRSWMLCGYPANTGKLGFYASSDGSWNPTRQYAIQSVDPVIDGNLHLFSATWNAGDGQLFLDGVPIDQSLLYNGPSFISNGPSDFTVGASLNNNSPQRFVTGDISEVRVSNTQRSPAWLKASYCSQWDDLVSYQQPESEESEEPGSYVTQYSYDSADRLVSVTYPNDETVNQTYNGRGLPYELSSSINGTLVDSMTYNQLGQVKQINLHNGVVTSYNYWGIDHETASFGKLYSISVSGESSLLDTEYTWDVRGNLLSRHTVHPSVDETEYFTYDSLDRLDTAILSGVYDLDYDYTTIGNIEKVNDVTYSYSGPQPHAVTSFGGTTYQYDENGNMLWRGSANQTIIWDAENRPVCIYNKLTAGFEATNNENCVSFNTTYINLINPVEADGIIDSVDVWAHTHITGLYVATFYCINGNVYKCRDSEYIPSVPAGETMSYSVSLQAEEGDLIGCYYETGRIVRDDCEIGELLYVQGKYINAGDQATYYPVSELGISISGTMKNNATTFTYDGDGNRVRKTVEVEGGDDILYINRYYEENLETENITTSYYLGDRLVAQKEGTDLCYVHQDHLSGTSLMTDDEGEIIGSVMKYYPYGDCRKSPSEIPTDRLFTGQRYDDTGLYYYSARYYDPEIGRFISPDTIVPDPMSSQAWNRYSYCLNNPLKYNDPSGHIVKIGQGKQTIDEKTLDTSWKLFKSACPDIAERMEKSSTEYTIDWSKGPIDSVVLGDGGDQTIWIQNDLKDKYTGIKQIGYIAAHIGHESFHAEEGHQANSVWEEANAFKRGYDTKTNINDYFSKNNPTGSKLLGFSDNERLCKDLTSGWGVDLDKQLDTIQTTWGSIKDRSPQENMYANLPRYPVYGGFISWNESYNLLSMALNLLSAYRPWS